MENSRLYRRDKSVVFMRSADAYGGLSNMASGYPLKINNISISTSEALYQACKYPHLPDVQQLIIEQQNPILAARIGRSYEVRPDWYDVNINVMRWCLKVKLIQNYESFGSLLRNTEDVPIVECSYRDIFWGAKPVDRENMTLIGTNALGRLLMELREQLLPRMYWLLPLDIPLFHLYGEPIEVVEITQYI